MREKPLFHSRSEINMFAGDEDAVTRWRSVRDWYRELIRETGWEFLQPMVELTEWVSQQPWAEALYPFTSHQWLCVQRAPSPIYGIPFFSCVTEPDGRFAFELQDEHGQRRQQHVCPVEESRPVFMFFVHRLQMAHGD